MLASGSLSRAMAAGGHASETVDIPSFDGVENVATFYPAENAAAAPLLIAIHGGGWKRGDPTFYREWGPYLAARGYAVMSIRYRLALKGPSYPHAVLDVLATVDYARKNAARLKIDPARIGLMGDSAGAQLAALAGLAGDEMIALAGKRGLIKPPPKTDVGVKAVVGVYGVYDMLAQWMHDQTYRPRDHITEQFLGVSPIDDRQLYFETSPISHAVSGNRKAAFLLAYGTHDEVVDPLTQTKPFESALKMAGFMVRSVVVLGAGHFWIQEPLDQTDSYSRYFAPRLLQFLNETL